MKLHAKNGMVFYLNKCEIPPMMHFFILNIEILIRWFEGKCEKFTKCPSCFQLKTGFWKKSGYNSYCNHIIQRELNESMNDIFLHSTIILAMDTSIYHAKLSHYRFLNYISAMLWTTIKNIAFFPS